MKENYIKYIINEMCRFYGYGVIIIDDIFMFESNWALVKNINYNKKRVILFIKSDEEKYDDFSLLEYLQLKLNCYDIDIVKIYLIDVKEYNLELNYTNLKDDLIYIDYKNNKIIKYGYKDQDFVQELASIIYNNEIANKKEKEKFKPIITYCIISLNIIIYIVTAILSKNIFYSDINVLIHLGAKYNPYIRQGQFYRLITCMFLHGGIVHLVLNMYSLYSIGPLVEKLYGKIKYIIIYFVSGIMSSLFSFMFSQGVSIGASGAIFGLLGTIFVFAIKMKEIVGKDFLRNITSVIIANLILGLTISNIDNFGHLGGIIGGIISGYLLYILKFKA
ncbi:rhomboid protease GluP [Clostridium sp. USBA 49]|uniref:rhomboid family intramembrane serine protease n=1 Tax=Clostridium sp. USBA 49 TaxID=1881060 RepID=UPI00099A4271|nr:rhomboid family intramembrane serine protease [Clostridium sp. USBA 49]SKA83891.1 rhomboid protease GluP [Clostridium sp. USBA 49]